MEQKTVTIPFDLETAKRINIGGIVGRIVTEKGRNRAEIVYVCVFICFLLWLIFTLLLSFTVIGLVISVSDEWQEMGDKIIDKL